MKNYLLLGLLFGYLCVDMAHATDKLGRLFFTEHERNEMTHLYQKSLIQQASATANPTPKAVLPSNITLNGLIIRSQGENTVWIDQKQNPQEEGLFGLELAVESLPLDQVAVPVLIHSGDIRVYLKPGQKMDTSNGWVTEAYGEQRTDVMPATQTLDYESSNYHQHEKPSNYHQTPSSFPQTSSSGGECPCSSSNNCIGPRGGVYCINSKGNKQYRPKD